MTLTPQEQAELRERHMWRGRFLTYATDEEELNVAYVCEGCEQQMDEELTCPTIRLLDALEAAKAEVERLKTDLVIAQHVHRLVAHQVIERFPDIPDELWTLSSENRSAIKDALRGRDTGCES